MPAMPTITCSSRFSLGAQRGAIAIITGMACMMFVVLCLAMAEIGMQALHKFEAHNAAESLAVGNALIVLSNASGNQQLLDAAPFIKTNILSVGDAAQSQINTIYGGEFDPPLWQMAGGGQASVTGTLPSFLTGLPQPKGQGGTAQAAVNQYMWPTLKPAPARVVLVLDYSRSMRLTYTGQNTDAAAALNVLRVAAKRIMKDPLLTGLVNWGLVEFAEADSGVATQPPLSTADSTDLNKLSAHQQALFALLDQPSFGNGTNMGTAMDEALTAMLPPTSDPNVGKSFMIVVSDGEPDDALNASGYDSVVQAAEAEALVQARRAWGNKVETLSILIDRTPSGNLTSPDLTAFMQSICGADNGSGTYTNEPGNFLRATPGPDGGDGMSGWLSANFTPTNLQVRCLSTTPVTPRANTWMATPTAESLMYAYTSPATAPTQETPLTRVFDPSLLVWKPGTNSNGSFYYDAVNKVVIVSPDVCSRYMAAPAGLKPSLRIRWGVPQLLSSTNIAGTAG